MKDSRYERPSSLAKYCYGNHELLCYHRSSPCPTEGLFATVDSLKFLIRISLRSLGCTSEKYFYLMTFLWYVFSVLGGIVSFCFVRLPLLMQRFREDWCFSFLLSIEPDYITRLTLFMCLHWNKLLPVILIMLLCRSKDYDVGGLYWTITRLLVAFLPIAYKI